MFSSSIFEILVFLSIFLRRVIADSNPHPDLQTGSDSSSSLDLPPDLGSRNPSTEPAPLLPTNGDYALLLSEQASSPFPLANGDNTGSLIRAESDGCSSAATQLSNKMRRAKRDNGICDAIQDTKKSDPIIQPGQEQDGGQENNGRTTPSSKNLPSPIPFPQPLKSGGADELCLSLASYYRVCAPAYLERKILFTTYDLDQCRPCMSFCLFISYPIPPKNAKCLCSMDLDRPEAKVNLITLTNRIPRLYSHGPRM